MSKAPAKKLTAEESWEQSKAKTVEIAKLEGRALTTNWQIIYETIDRWTLKNTTASQERAALIVGSNRVQKEIRDAARSVDAGTHEQINASSQAELLINTALGRQVSESGRVFERTAKMNDGSQSSLTNIAINQRFRTAEGITRPVPAKEVRNVAKRVTGADLDKHVFGGHTNAGHYNPEGTPLDKKKDQVVTSAGSSTGGIHKMQLESIRKSSHHKSLSMRLSKDADTVQEDGSGILEAFENGGFLEASSWQGVRIKNAEDALAAAMVASHNYKKRQTKEKNLREPYADPASISESYKEINTESETKTDEFKDFAERAVKKDVFKEFAEKYHLNTKSRAFATKLQSAHNKVSGKDRPASI